MANLTRRIFKIVGRTFAVLVILLALAVGATQTGWFKNWLRGFVVSKAAAVLNGHLAIGGLSGSLFTGVTLDRVSLVQDGATVFAADKITIRYDPIVLARGHIEFMSVKIERLNAAIVEGESGWNVANLLKPTDPTGRTAPREIAFHKIDLTDGIVSIQQRGQSARRLSAMDATTALVTNKDGLQLDVSQFSATDEQSGLRVTKFSGTSANTFATFAATFDAASGASTIQGRVTGQMPDGRRHIAGDVNVAHLDLARLLANPDLDSDLTGHATVDLKPSPDAASSVVAVAFDGPAVRAFGYEASQIRANATITGRRVDARATAVAYGASTSSTITWTAADPTAHTTDRVTVVGDFNGLDLVRLPASLDVPVLPSRLAGHFALRVVGPRWNTDVTLRQSQIAGTTLAAGFSARVAQDGRAMYYSARGHVSDLALAKFADPLRLPLLGQPRFAGQINGDLDITGTEPRKGDRSFKASAVLADSTVGDARISLMTATANLAANRLAVEADGAFANLGSTLLGFSTAKTFVLNGTMRGGFVWPDIRADMDIETAEAHGRVDLGPSTINGLAIDVAHLDGTLVGGVATVAQLEATGPLARVSGKGVVALGHDGQSDFTFVGDTDDLTPVAALFDAKASGVVHIEAKATGPADHLTATGVVNGHSVTYGDDVSALNLNVSFTTDVVDRQFAAAVVQAKTDATFVTIAGQEIVKITATTKFESPQLDVDALIEQPKRSIDLAGLLAFTPEQQEVRLRKLALSASGADWRLPQGQEGRVRYASGVVTIDGVTLVNANQGISASGSLLLEAGHPAPADPLALHVTNVDVAELNRLLLGTLNLQGLVNGAVEVRGLASDPDVIANLAIANPAVNDAKFESLSGRVTIAKRVATADLRLQESATNALLIVGDVPLSTTSPAPLKVDVTSTAINLGFLQAFTTELEKVTGTADLNVHVTGTLAAPQIDGSVTVANGAFRVPATGIQYRDLTVRASMAANRLVFNELHVADDDGHVLKATGGVDVITGSAPRVLDLAFTTDDFHLLRNALGDIQVTSALSLAGDLNNPRIEGNIRVTRGRLEVDEILGRTSKSTYRSTPDVATTTEAELAKRLEAEGVAPPTRTPTSPIDAATIDVSVRLPDNMVLRGRDMHVAAASLGIGDMNITVGGTLNVRKRPAGPTTIVGGLEVVRGYYDFQGRRFDVERGSGVTFRGGRQIDPGLSITAEREVSGVVARVNVNGTALEPTVNLSSTPPLDQGDLLSLIVFNQPINGLGETQKQSLASRAGTMAAGAVATPIADSVGRALNLDQFEILAAGENGAGPSVLAGRQIGTRIFVGVRQEFAGDELSTVSFEYRLAKVLRLVTSVAQSAQGNARKGGQGGTAADLLFVIRY